MVRRLIALLAVLVLACASIAGQAQTLLRATGPEAPALAVQCVPDRASDTVEQAAQLSQMLAEAAVDLPALGLEHPCSVVSALTMARPRPHILAQWRTPTLAGPQRPPCDAA
jgi:hypothetical protein